LLKIDLKQIKKTGIEVLDIAEITVRAYSL